MPWVHSHRRRLPYSFFRTTRVRSHYRRSPHFPIVAIVIGVIALLFIVALL